MSTYDKARKYEINKDIANAIYYYHLAVLQGNDLGLKKLEYLENDIIRYLEKYNNRQINLDFVQLLCYWFNTKPNLIIRGFNKEFDSLSISSNWSHIWFAKNAEQTKIDENLKSFEELYDKYKNYDPTYLYEYVAMIILYDQIPRNIFRNTPKAYETDSIAFKYAKFLSNYMEYLPLHVNIFIILSFCHQESKDEHKRCVDLVQKIKDKYKRVNFEIVNTLYQIFQNHYDRIIMFGRIPERNNILNRQSTILEKVFMNNL